MDDIRKLPARHLRATVEEAVRDGATLAEIERDIVDAAFLDTDERAALWLYAWGTVERRKAGKPLTVVNAESGFNVH